MKILHLLAQHPAKTGSGTSLQKTIEYMDHEANEQFAPYGLNANQEEVDVGCPSKAVVFSLEEDGQWLFGMSDAMPYPTNTYESMTDDQYDVWKNKWDRVIIDTLEDFQPDIIICHHLYLLLERVLQHALVPVVCVCHGTDIDQLAKNPKHRAIVRDVSQDIAMVFTNGPAQNEPIQNLLGIDADRLQIFGGGYDETYFYPPKKPKELPPVQLVFTGKISEHKGMRPLFYALEKVMKEIPLHLTIIGSGVGEEAEDLIALGESLQIPITYRGHLAQEDIGLLYHDMHILILPSYAEGLSLVVLEALGAGLRVVATDLTARPGAGKSTLLLQMAAQYATSGKNVLYASGEESAAQIRARADRILSPIPQNIWLFATTDLDAVLAQAEHIHANILIVDSIQTFRIQEHSQRAGTPVQTVACTEKIVQHCKSGPQKCAAILVGHMTKNDEMAGLRTLEHMVDTVLLLEGGDMDELRMLRSTKNRFGQTGEVAVFAMEHTGLREITDPSEHFITHRDKGVIGSAKAVIREGTRTFIIEVESLVSKSYSPYPIRISENMSRDRLNTLLSILEERAGLSLQDKNVIIKTTGGVRLTEPASDLAVMMSVASSNLKTSIPEHVVYAAEVGLTGELKRVTYEKQRMKEAQRLGYTLVGIDMKSGRTVSEIISVLK